jgi:hypothetical protein
MQSLQALQNIRPDVLIVWAFCALGIYHLLREILWRLRPRRESRSDPNPHLRRIDSAEQLRWVMAASFAPKKVMSFSEYRVFKEIEAEAAAINGGFRVFAQTSLGEVIESKNSRAHSAINSKRADILVVGPNGLPVLAVEYQGGGHYRFDAAARDAVKKEALRKAGVAYVEVVEGEQPDAIRSKVRAVLGQRAAA